MWLEQVSISNCRSLAEVELELTEHGNWFVGPNGAGKSAFLEALSILSRGRSFRTPRIQEVIRHNSELLTVVGKVYDAELDKRYPLGISKTVKETRIRINHADIQQQAELTRYLPLTVIHADSLGLLAGAPAQRRALLDWIAFYNYSDFHQDWRNYQRILKQRNACLRDPLQHYALPHWTEQLVMLIPRIHQFRESALSTLNKVLGTLTPLLEGTGVPALKLQSGFPAAVVIDDKQALIDFFADKRDHELYQATTLYGCHRGDLQVLTDNRPFARIASRGQLKMMSIALLIAQSQAVDQGSVKRGMIAIDDMASELDKQNQGLLYQVLGNTQQQLIVTSTHQPVDVSLSENDKVFHVKHGTIYQAS